MLVRAREDTSGIAGAFGAAERRGVDDPGGGAAGCRCNVATGQRRARVGMDRLRGGLLLIVVATEAPRIRESFFRKPECRDILAWHCLLKINDIKNQRAIVTFFYKAPNLHFKASFF